MATTRVKLTTFWVLRKISHKRAGHAMSRYHRDRSCWYIHVKDNFMEIKAPEPGIGGLITHKFENGNVATMRPCAHCGL